MGSNWVFDWRIKLASQSLIIGEILVLSGTRQIAGILPAVRVADGKHERVSYLTGMVRGDVLSDKDKLQTKQNNKKNHRK